MRKNNILIVLPTDLIGGAERVSKNLINYLASINIKVTIYFLAKGRTGTWQDLECNKNVRIIYGNSSSEFKGVFPFVFWLTKNRFLYDYVYSTHVHINFFICILRRLSIILLDKHIARESTVIFERFHGYKRVLFKFIYKFYGNIDLLIFQTNHMKESLINEVPSIRNQNFKVIKNPLDLKNISNSLNVFFQNIPNSNSNSNSNFRLLFVGRVVKVKNLPLLIYSIKNCLDKGISNIKLDVVGDGDLMEEMKELVNKLELSNLVEFHGNIGNPYKLMSKADLGLITSIKEGFPNVLIEMMASGTKNIITTPCAGDLITLPNVKVMDGFSIEELTSLIEKSINEPKDFSINYTEYAKNLDVSKFWENILNNS
ncbi:glycosyltransferase [Pseudoalteromonas simplex]|uniref:glycosyltransferase n=1 Tax=Pseudoalteromonas simplex TaxID=2783613 RepID=UPI001887B7F2|nr:glycosyltransferase [Pseudoalteromonas sp. A520]